MAMESPASAISAAAPSTTSSAAAVMISVVPNRASQELYTELGAQNPRFKRLHEQWDRSRTEQVQWARVAEDSLANFLAVSTAQR